jgi:signal transduction histidine kinase
VKVRLFRLTRPFLALLLLALVLVAVSGLLELSGSVRLAVSQAAVEAGLISGSVQQELGRLASAAPGDSLNALCRDPRLREVMMNGLARAPSVLYIAVLDPVGRVAAHTEPGQVGSALALQPPLPVVRCFSQSLRLLWGLWRVPPTYQVETALQRGGELYAVIRVAMAGSFLWEAVRQAASRGILAALIVISMAVLAGIGLTRLAVGRLRLLEDGVAAIRAGRFEEKLPESGAGEFSQLAAALNLLGEQYNRERRERAAPMPDASKVLVHLGQAAAGVAHEMRNNLQVVQVDLELLRTARQLSPEEVHRRVEGIIAGVGSVSGAVRGFLKVARVRSLEAVPLQLNDLLRELEKESRPQAELAGVDLRLECDPSLPETLADPEVLRQALQNLIRNSLQALVGLEGQVVLRSEAGEGRARISVADNGPGIPPEILERIFELYFTTRKDGSGVGLALVRQAAELHGGDVIVRSTVGEGTEVVLEIPLLNPATGRG